MLERLQKKNEDIIIMGDKNLDVKKYQDNNYILSQLTAKIEEWMINNRQTQIIEKDTRIVIEVENIHRSRIDHVYTKNETKIKHTEVIKLRDCDHRAIIFITKDKIRPNYERNVHKMFRKN